MNKPAKIVLGIFTFLPLIVAVSLIVFVFYQFLSIFSSDNPMLSMMAFSYIGYIFPLMFFFFLFYIGLGIFYLVQVAQNEFFDTEKKLLWTAVIFCLNWISMPLYWYFHIWKRPDGPRTEFNPQLENDYESGTEPQKF